MSTSAYPPRGQRPRNSRSKSLAAQIARVTATLGVFGALAAFSPAQAGLLVAGEDSGFVGHVYHYNNAGAYLGEFTSGGPALDGPNRVRIGPDGKLYVLSGGNTVHRYSAITGSYINTFIPTKSNSLDDAKDMVFGPGGDLFISANCGNASPFCNTAYTGEGGRVLRFDGTTGAAKPDFVVNGAGPGGTSTLSEAMSLAFGPSDTLYVGNDPRAVNGFNAAYNVMRFDATGAYLDTPLNSVSGSGASYAFGLHDPNGMVIGPDGNLYISSEGLSDAQSTPLSNPNVIFKLNLTTGMVSEFVSTNSLLNAGGPYPPGTGLIEPEGIVFGPDGNLYVASGDTGEVYRYDGTTGAPVGSGVFVAGTAEGLHDPKGLLFIPDAPGISIGEASSGGAGEYTATINGSDWSLAMFAVGNPFDGDPTGTTNGWLSDSISEADWNSGLLLSMLKAALGIADDVYTDDLGEGIGLNIGYGDLFDDIFGVGAGFANTYWATLSTNLIGPNASQDGFTFGSVPASQWLAVVTNGAGDILTLTGSVGVPVPEPGTLALFGLGLAGLAFARRRRVARS